MRSVCCVMVCLEKMSPKRGRRQPKKSVSLFLLSVGCPKTFSLSFCPCRNRSFHPKCNLERTKSNLCRMSSEFRCWHLWTAVLLAGHRQACNMVWGQEYVRQSQCLPSWAGTTWGAWSSAQAPDRYDNLWICSRHLELSRTPWQSKSPSGCSDRYPGFKSQRTLIVDPKILFIHQYCFLTEQNVNIKREIWLGIVQRNLAQRGNERDYVWDSSRRDIPNNDTFWVKRSLEKTRNKQICGVIRNTPNMGFRVKVCRWYGDGLLCESNILWEKYQSFPTKTTKNLLFWAKMADFVLVWISWEIFCAEKHSVHTAKANFTLHL